MANVTLRNFDDKTYRELKAEAARDGITVVEALTRAVSTWLTIHTHKKKKKSVLAFKPWDWGKGTEKSSEEIDKVLYGAE